MAAVTAQNGGNRSLQREAIEKVRNAFAELPNGDKIFQQCVDGKESITDVLTIVFKKHASFKQKKATRLLQAFQRHTLWLQNISEIVDVVVQTEAGIGCPVWAPIKFVLKISSDYYETAESLLRVVETMSENLPRLEIYQKLQPDGVLHILLLNLFSEIVEFSVTMYRYFGRGTFGRIALQIRRPFKDEFGNMIERLERHTKLADRTAVAIELLKAEEFRQETELKHRNDLQIRCQAWLKPANMRAIHQSQMEAKLAGNCNWIWDNDIFRRWSCDTTAPPETDTITVQAPNSMPAAVLDMATGPSRDENSPPLSERLLGIYGIHGCGKSVLASSLIDGFENMGHSPLFFSFSGSDGRQSTISLAQSLLSQLLQRTKHEYLHIVEILMAKGDPLESDLWDALITILRLRPIHSIIVDGADESSASSQTLIDRFHSMTLTMSLKVIILGRTYALRAALEGKGNAIEISSAMTKGDINAYLTHMVDQHELLRVPSARSTVIEKLQEKADGMFLWVKLMIDDLGRSANESQVMKRLKDLPSGLESAYRHILMRFADQLDSYEREFVKNILSLAAVAMRTMSVEEVNIAQALLSGPPDTFKARLETRIERNIQRLCNGLVIVECGHVRLVHFSLKEFLTRQEEECIRREHNPRVASFRVEQDQAHQALSECCIDYLGTVVYENQLYNNDNFSALENRYQFLGYASRYMIVHINSSQTSPRLSSRVSEFLESPQFFPRLEYFAVIVLEDNIMIMLERELDRLVTKIYPESQIAASVFLELLHRGQEELDRRSGLFGSDDPRTQQWYTLLLYVQVQLGGEIDKALTLEAESLAEVSAEVPAQVPAQVMSAESNIATAIYCPKRQRQFSRMKSLTPDSGYLATMITTLQAASPIPLFRQVDILLKLGVLKKSVTVLTDPLKLLFRLILAKASALPNIALIAVGNFYHHLEKYEEAYEVYSAAWNRLKGYGTDMEYFVMESMAGSLLGLERYQDAELLFRQAWLGRCSLLGPQDRTSLSCAIDLCLCLQKQKKYEETEQLGRQIWLAKCESLGRNHESSLDSAADLALYLHELERYEEAEALDREVWTVRCKILGNDHEKSLDSAVDLGADLDNLGRFEEAGLLVHQAWLDQCRILGAEHESTLLTASNLALNLIDGGRYEEGEALSRQNWLSRCRILGKEAEDSLDSASSVTCCLSGLGRHEEAEVITRQTLLARRRVLGVDHGSTMRSVLDLAKTLGVLGRYEESAAYYREAWHVWKRTKGEQHPETLWVASQLAYCLYKLNRVEEAETITPLY